MTWLEYLKANGATDEDAKILDTPVARRAFDKQQADALALVEAEKARSLETLENYRSEMVTWQGTVEQNAAQARANEIAAKADAQAAQAIVREAAKSNAALKEVAIKAGWKFEDDKTTPPVITTTTTTTEKDYYTRAELAAVMRQEREAILLAQEIPAEHARLFPGQPFSFRALVDEAEKAKKPAGEYWESKYKVAEARAKLAADAKLADETRIRTEEREKVTREMADKYGNPQVRPLVSSDNPFTKIVKPAENKQPWERQSAEHDRVSEAAKRVGDKLRSQGFTN